MTRHIRRAAAAAILAVLGLGAVPAFAQAPALDGARLLLESLERGRAINTTSVAAALAHTQGPELEAFKAAVANGSAASIAAESPELAQLITVTRTLQAQDLALATSGALEKGTGASSRMLGTCGVKDCVFKTLATLQAATRGALFSAKATSLGVPMQATPSFAGEGVYRIGPVDLVLEEATTPGGDVKKRLHGLFRQRELSYHFFGRRTLPAEAQGAWDFESMPSSNWLVVDDRPVPSKWIASKKIGGKTWTVELDLVPFSLRTRIDGKIITHADSEMTVNPGSLAQYAVGGHLVAPKSSLPAELAGWHAPVPHYRIYDAAMDRPPADAGDAIETDLSRNQIFRHEMSDGSRVRTSLGYWREGASTHAIQNGRFEIQDGDGNLTERLEVDWGQPSALRTYHPGTSDPAWTVHYQNGVPDGWAHYEGPIGSEETLDVQYDRGVMLHARFWDHGRIRWQMYNEHGFSVYTWGARPDVGVLFPDGTYQSFANDEAARAAMSRFSPSSGLH